MPPNGSFFLHAHDRLSTCRSNGFGLGQIPWTAIMQYGLHAGLSHDMLDVLVIIIYKMDEAFTEWHTAEAKKSADAQSVDNLGRQTGPVKTPKMIG